MAAAALHPGTINGSWGKVVPEGSDSPDSPDGGRNLPPNVQDEAGRGLAHRIGAFFDSTTKIVVGLTGLLVAIAGLITAFSTLGVLGERDAPQVDVTTNSQTTSQRSGETRLRVPVSGTYSGIGAERGSVNKDLRVVMIFSSESTTVSYPSLDCFGTLHPLGFDQGRRIYMERITSGPCTQGGVWRIRVESPRQLDAFWSLASVDYTVSVVLKR